MTKAPLISALLLTAVAVAAPAAAATKEKTSFTHDGVTYVYSQTKVGDSLVIQGHATDGPDFYYVVRKGQVVGKTDDMPVSFGVADAKNEAGEVEVASAR